MVIRVLLLSVYIMMVFVMLGDQLVFLIAQLKKLQSVLSNLQLFPQRLRLWFGVQNFLHKYWHSTLN